MNEKIVRVTYMKWSYNWQDWELREKFLPISEAKKFMKRGNSMEIRSISIHEKWKQED